MYYCLRCLFVITIGECDGVFICDDGKCLPGDMVCDGSPDCMGLEDELDCRKQYIYIIYIYIYISCELLKT